MSIQVLCSCGHVLTVDQVLAGSSICCPRCHVDVVVPPKPLSATGSDTRVSGSARPQINTDGSSAKTARILFVSTLVLMFLSGVAAIVVIMRPRFTPIADDRGAIESVVKNYFEALKIESADANRPVDVENRRSFTFLTKKAREQMKAAKDGPKSLSHVGATFNVGSAVIDDQQALVPITCVLAERR